VFGARRCSHVLHAHENADEVRRHENFEELVSDTDSRERADIPLGKTRGTLRQRLEAIDVLHCRDVAEDLQVFEVVPTEVAMTTPRSEQREPRARSFAT
jgi:hypothetical protein